DLAYARLESLLVELSRTVVAARTEFYHRAWPLHESSFDATIRRDDIGPDDEGAAVARNAQIGGRDAYQDLAAIIDSAMTALPIAANAARVPSTPAESRQAILVNWEVRPREAISRQAKTILSDSQIAIHNAVGRLMIKPELQ